MGSPEYPWYARVEGSEIEQGDILLTCPRFVIPPKVLDGTEDITVEVETVQAIVLTQSCDLARRGDGSYEVDDVILCRVHSKGNLTEHDKFRKNEAWDDVRRGRMNFFHVLNKGELHGLAFDYLLVDFHEVFTLGREVVQQQAQRLGPRPRLLPPYREHLSQAFARVFMRVGLPADIPPFSGKGQSRPAGS